MGFYYDREQVNAAGAMAYSKYGKVRNSRELKLPQKMLDKCGEKGKVWFRNVAPGTMQLEQGNQEIWEEQLMKETDGISRLRLLRMAKSLGENSRAYQNILPRLRELGLAPEEKKDIVKTPDYLRGIENKRIFRPFHCIMNYNSPSERINAQIDSMEEKGDIRGIINYILLGKDLYLCYMAPWEVESEESSGSYAKVKFPEYPDVMKRKVIQVYLTIAGLKQCDTRLTEELCIWAAEAMITIGQAEELAQTCKSLLDVWKERESQSLPKLWEYIYSVSLRKIAMRNTLESLLALKRLESKGEKEAAYALGIKYMYGCGCEKDYYEAQKYFTKGKAVPFLAEVCEKELNKAVRQGDFYEVFKAAMKKMETDRFQDGIVELERLAGEYGFADAKYELAKLMETGYRYKQDQKKALDYYNSAAENGHKDAQRKMLQITEQKLLGVNNSTFEFGLKGEVARWKALLAGLPVPPDHILRAL